MERNFLDGTLFAFNETARKTSELRALVASLTHRNDRVESFDIPLVNHVGTTVVVREVKHDVQHHILDD